MLPARSSGNIKRKIELYLAYGSQLVLDVDPAKRTITVHDATSIRALHDGDVFEHPAVPGLSFDVRALFDGIRAI